MLELLTSRQASCARRVDSWRDVHPLHACALAGEPSTPPGRSPTCRPGPAAPGVRDDATPETQHAARKCAVDRRATQACMALDARGLAVWSGRATRARADLAPRRIVHHSRAARPPGADAPAAPSP